MAHIIGMLCLIKYDSQTSHLRTLTMIKITEKCRQNRSSKWDICIQIERVGCMIRDLCHTV